MILNEKIVLLISACVFVLVSELWAARKRVKATRKPTIDELPLQHILLRSIMKHDGCRLYFPWSNFKNPSFELNNATCWHGCKIVADLYEDRNPTEPRLIRSGGCTKGLKIVFLECKCQLTRHYARILKWRSLKHCAHTYLQGIVDFSINDTRPSTTSTTTKGYDVDDYLAGKLNTKKNDEALTTTGLTTEVATTEAMTTTVASTTTALQMLTAVVETEQAAMEMTSVGVMTASTMLIQSTEALTTIPSKPMTTITTTPTTTSATTTTKTTTTTLRPTTRKKKKKPNKPWRRMG